jgi:hypothetical protein
MTQPVLLALLFNLLPVVCAPLFGWRLLSLMLLYWAENLIVGVINVAKMIIAGVTKGPKEIFSLLFDVPFFIVHYGMFCAVHGVLILVLFSGAPEKSVSDPFHLPAAFIDQVRTDRFLALNLLMLAVFHLYRFVTEWVQTKEWRNVKPIEQMFMPYGRIIVVHVAVLLGGFLGTLIGNPLIAVMLLALLKTVLEVGAAQVRVTTTAALPRKAPS